MNNDIKKKRRKFRLSRLFKNTQFILVVSLLVSITAWITINLSDGNETTTTIVNIPVNISLSEETINDGLKIFSGNEQYASVSVTGNRVALGNLSSEDIIVTADGAGSITTPGTYPLSLIATKANSTDNFDITSSVSPSVITIYVDHADKEKFEIENNLVYNVAEGYHANLTLSHKKITIQGPESEVSKISSVAIEGNINGELKDSRELECEVKLYDHSGNLYSNKMLELSTDKVNVVLNVEPEKLVPIRVKFKNNPSGLNVDNFVRLKTTSIYISAPKEELERIDAIYTDEVDFATLRNKKTKLILSFDVPNGCTNLSEVSKTEAIIDFSEMNSRTINVTNFKVKNPPDDYYYDITTENIKVKVVGDKYSIKDIKLSDISCVINASDLNGKTGSITLPVEISIYDNNSCWIYGNYEVNIYVTKK